MNPEDQNYDHPVAYDAEGKPLYAHPPKKAGPAPKVARSPRINQSTKPEATDEAKTRHERSKRLFPSLNLSEGEYIISAVRRHPIGLVIPLGLGTLVIAGALSILANYKGFVEALSITGPMADQHTVNLPIWLFCVLIALGMFIIYYVYVNNKFFLTNESVIQEIQVTLFSRLEQTVSLSNIEDASYTQAGILQTIFDYGSIRLSTEGQHTTYTFTYVASPKMHIATLNNSIEAFKYSHPVDPNEDD